MKFTVNKADFENGINVLDMLVNVNLVPSKSEARRLITQGGLFIDDSKIDDIGYAITEDALNTGIKVRKGKKNFYKVLIG